MHIRPVQDHDTSAVISLWQACGLTRPWNDPAKDIERKLTVQPDLFLIGELGGRIIASAMGGYDGHRGNVYYLAKLAGIFRLNVQDLGAMQTGVSVEEFKAALLAHQERTAA